MNNRALVIDSMGEQRKGVRGPLERAEMKIDRANGNLDGFHCVLESPPALILMGREEDEKEGEDLLVTLSRVTKAPVIVVGRGGEKERIEALEKGADVYLRKPFSEEVLEAWVKALMWRWKDQEGEGRKEEGMRRIASVPLSATERRLALCLLAREGNLVTSKELLQETWGGKAGPATLVFYLRRLRQKLMESSAEVKLVSVRGLGHRLVSIN